MANDQIFLNKTLAIIPARKGSKSIKNKNRKTIDGKNLVQNTLEFCEKSNLFDFICVTSDDNFFLKKNYKNIFFIKRGKKLAQDKSSLNNVLINTLKLFEIKNGFLPKVLIILQPTSWFRDKKLIKLGLEKIYKKKRVFSIHPINDTLSNIFYMQNNKNIFLNKKRIDFKQGEKKLYSIDGNFFMVLTEEFLKTKKIFDKKFFCIQTTFPQNIEIDNIDQLKLTKKLKVIY